ncbi:nuclease-related domain-containing protein [Nocardioides pocheonensis]|uniref:NERD domain-containing protein n=1 Tax=Nocardioides pocheonensis TaxID=661485 RepID=A0A3N0GV10_9ACTN|nr:nuclease-related domain-containing protein [Nocardioides pocheonensis]RNM16294.1 NERD domain-containing protein [Nocardioides pocheonensis]
MAELSAQPRLARTRDVSGPAGKGSRGSQRRGEGQQATAAGLDLLRVLGWLVLHEVDVPGAPAVGAPDVAVDHLLVGPSGVYVVNTVTWPGPIKAEGDVLTVGKQDHSDILVETAAAADAVRTLLGGTPVAPLLCFERLEAVAGVAGDVALCASENILDLLTSQPQILDPAAVARASGRISAACRPGVVPDEPVRAKAPTPPARRPASGPSVEELARARAAELAAQTETPASEADATAQSAAAQPVSQPVSQAVPQPVSQPSPVHERHGFARALRRSRKTPHVVDPAPVETIAAADSSPAAADTSVVGPDESASVARLPHNAVAEAGAALWRTLTESPDPDGEAPAVAPDAVADAETEAAPVDAVVLVDDPTDVEAALAEAEARQLEAEARAASEGAPSESATDDLVTSSEPHDADMELHLSAEREAHDARARAAREALEQAQREALEAETREQEAREQEAREQAEREEAERLERERLEAEAREQAEREEAERLERERLEAEAREQAEREAREQAAREQAEREEAERLEREAREQAAREQAEREEAERLERERLETVAREQAEREEAERLERERIEAEAREQEAREQAEREAREAEEAEARAAWEVRLRSAREAREREAREAAARDAVEAEQRELIQRHQPDVRRGEVLLPDAGGFAHEPAPVEPVRVDVRQAVAVATDEVDLDTWEPALDDGWEPEVLDEPETAEAAPVVPVPERVPAQAAAAPFAASPTGDERPTSTSRRNRWSKARRAARSAGGSESHGHGMPGRAIANVALGALLIAGVAVGAPHVPGVVTWAQQLVAHDRPTTVGTMVKLDADPTHPAVEVLAGTPVPARAANGAGAGKGQHLVAVPFRLHNTGLSPWRAPVATKASIIDQLGVAHPVATSVTAVKTYPLLPAKTVVAPGQEIQGYAVFAVPDGRTITSVKLGLSQAGGDPVTWQVTP